MGEQNRAIHPLYDFLPVEIEGFDSLAELALDMRWSWNHATDEVWRQLDAPLWELTQNPWGVLQTSTVSAARPASDYTARVIPCFDKATIPLEEARILWQQ